MITDCWRGHWILWRRTEGKPAEPTRLRFIFRSSADRAARRLTRQAEWLRTVYYVRHTSGYGYKPGGKS